MSMRRRLIAPYQPAFQTFVVALVLSTAAMATVAGCGVGQPAGALLPGAFGEPLTSLPCERGFRDEVLGFGFDPPGDSDGPNTGGASNGDLFNGVWKSGSQRYITANVRNIGTTKFEDAIQVLRNTAGFRGMQMLEDRPIAFSSGRVGWLLKTGSPGGTTEMLVLDTRRGYLFGLGVDISGARQSEIDEMNGMLLSFCVEP